MDIAGLLRALGALSAVLALLGGALWAVRRYDLALPGRIGGRRAARLAITERLSLDPKRSIALIRNGAAEHLLLLAPEGNMLLAADDRDTGPLAIDLALCRALAGAVPIPPTPPPALWPMPPRLPARPANPRHDPLPARPA